MLAKPFPDSKISSRYGWRPLAGGTFHEGIDYALGMRTPLPALADGMVVAVGETKKYGKYIVVKADSGGYYRWHAIDSARYDYGHKVHVGETIAYSGRTGFWTTGPHAHLQTTSTISPSTHFDPLSVLSSAEGAGSGSAAKPIPIPTPKGPLMALNDSEQEELLTKTRAVYDALFTEGPTSRGTEGGVLVSLREIRRVAQANYDALFTTSPTSRGTSGGVLASLAQLLKR